MGDFCRKCGYIREGTDPCPRCGPDESGVSIDQLTPVVRAVLEEYRDASMEKQAHMVATRLWSRGYLTGEPEGLSCDGCGTKVTRDTGMFCHECVGNVWHDCTDCGVDTCLFYDDDEHEPCLAWKLRP